MDTHEDAAWHRLRKVVPYCLIVAALGLICFALAGRKSEPATRTDTSVILQWQDAAHEARLPEPVIDRVTGFLADGLAVLPPASVEAPHPDLRDSLRRFLAEFRWAFADSEEGTDFSRWLAWLVLEAVG